MCDPTTTSDSGQVQKVFAYKPELKIQHIMSNMPSTSQVLITVMNAPSGGLGGVRSDDPVPMVAPEAPATVSHKVEEPRFQSSLQRSAPRG